MKVLVVGASGGSGRAVVRYLVSSGHDVTAFVRQRLAVVVPAETVRYIDGDVSNPHAVDQAVAGKDAVVVTLGIRENALRVRLCGSMSTPMNVRSLGTRHVISAMQRHGVRRLLVQTSYGVGPTRDRLPISYKALFALLLKPQIEDTEVQEMHIRRSGLDWTIVQPVSLYDTTFDEPPFASPIGETRSMRVSREQVGYFLADALGQSEQSHQTVALSATRHQAH
jgi:uncharacterized protein YbjT (DUF2867 family)